MEKVGEIIEKVIQENVERILSSTEEFPDVQYIATDNLAEAIEKLVILHIRTWMLEDAVQQASTDTEIASLKKKIDICFKVKRPKLVEAINLMVDDAVKNGKELKENSVKLYKGV